MAARDEIIAFCDELLAADRFDDYGPNGLQVPGAREVERIATGVTANREFLVAAHEAGAQMALVHHGLFFGDAPQALSEAAAERLRVVLGAGISVAAYHLPLDAHPEIGNNALLCRQLGFEPEGRGFGGAKGSPIGVVGRSAEGVPAAELFERVERELDRAPLVFDAGPDTVRAIGVVTGGGSRFLAEAAALGLDAFVTGEPSEQVMGEAREAGIHFIAAGHYATEVAGIRALGDAIAGRFGVEHRFIDIPNPI